MAMKALTAVAPRARRPIAPARKFPSSDRDWREIMIRQDAKSIWQRLSALVRLTFPERDDEHDAITQEVFLDLISGERINTYIEENYSGEEIRQEVGALIVSARK